MGYINLVIQKCPDFGNNLERFATLRLTVFSDSSNNVVCVMSSPRSLNYNGHLSRNLCYIFYYSKPLFHQDYRQKLQDILSGCNSASCGGAHMHPAVFCAVISNL